MMTEHDGLCSLQMGIAGHDRLFIHLRLIGESGDQVLGIGAQLIHAVHQIHPQIERDLIVSGARGMELLAGLSDPFDQMGLHEAVDILIAVFKDQRAFFNIHQDPAQAAADLVRFLLADDPLPSQHGGVGYAAGDILIIKPAVKSQ